MSVGRSAAICRGLGASSFDGVMKLYIQVTVDLQNYNGEVFDLQLSNYLPVKKVIEIVWQVKKITVPPREGYWIRVQNKEFVCNGYETLMDSGITTGDRVEIL